MKKLLPFLLSLLSVILIEGGQISYAQTLLNPVTQPKFVRQLPIPGVIDARAGGVFTVAVTQFKQDLGLVDPVTLTPLQTTVWGYQGSYPGPTILAKKDIPCSFFWANNLTNGSGQLLSHLLPIDNSVHWAFSGVADWQSKGIPIVTHLHGGLTESASDGLPDQWYTPNFADKGAGFIKGQTEPFLYSNNQDAATIWYHDHALGITRLNVYAGMAGFYLITDDNEILLKSQNSLPADPYDMGLAIQDRMFTSAGELYYPSQAPLAGAPDPSVQPEFFGDFILVNGMTWPVLDVEPRQYRFRLLNGSDSRFYNLALPNNLTFLTIGSDGGLLPAPVTTNRILIAPGERKDIIIDFSKPGLRNKTIIMTNDARTPFPRGFTVNSASTGQIMAFRVSKLLNQNFPATRLPASLRPLIAPLVTALPSRQLILFEGMDVYGRLQTRLGTPASGGLGMMDPITENPALNSTEIWEIYNNTVDAHPIHLHMVKMQLLNRQGFSATVNLTTGVTTNILLKGSATTPKPEEAGWKDTYITYPGEVTRLITTFNIPGPSVWHCHILSHEDHEMMRPYFIGNMTTPMALRQSAKAADVTANLEKELQFRTRPNPFSSELQLEFTLAKKSAVSIQLYDSKGSIVKDIFKGKLETGPQQFTINGSQWSNGTYFCEVVVDNQRIERKFILQK
jgi:spore coat protein A, manganese oxidase